MDGCVTPRPLLMGILNVTPDSFYDGGRWDDPEHPQTMDHIIELMGAEAMPWSYGVDCCGGSLTLNRSDVVVHLVDKLAVAARELQKVKNQSLANSFRRLQSNFYLLLQLLFYDVLGDWEYLNTSPAKIQAVTADDLLRVAKEAGAVRALEKPFGVGELVEVVREELGH